MSDVIDLGFRPRPWQAECCRQFKPHSVVVVHRRGGKTVLAVMKLVDAALRCEKPRGRFAYVAPLLKQAKGIAWDYLKAYARKVPGTVIQEAELWVEFPNYARVRIYGADNPDSLRGLYFDGVVVDEVAQIKLELWEQVLQPALADRNGWVLFIGTPKGVNLFSQIYYKALSDPHWFAASYNVHQTDALPAEKVAQLQAASAEAVWRQEFLCDFTASSENTLIPIDDALAASQRNLLHPRLYEFAPKVLGVDVAHDGGDRCVIFPRQGLQAFKPRVWQGLPEKTFAARVGEAIDHWQPDAVFVDTTGGYGSEVVSRLRDTGHLAQDVVFSWKASTERFANLRAEMYFKLAEWLKTGALARHEYLTQLQSELCAPTFSNDNAAMRFTLESKADIKARIGVSPDLADALALTFAFPVASAAQRSQPAHAATDFDPYPAEVYA